MYEYNMKAFVFLIIVSLMEYNGIVETATRHEKNQENPIEKQAKNIKIVTSFKRFYNLLAAVIEKYREQYKMITMGECCYDITKNVDTLDSFNVIVISVILASKEAEIIQSIVKFPIENQPRIFIDEKTIDTMRRFTDFTDDASLNYDLSSIILQTKYFLRSFEPTLTYVDWLPQHIVESISWRKMQNAISCLAFVHRVEFNEDFFQSFMNGVKAIVTTPPKMKRLASVERLSPDPKSSSDKIIDEIKQKTIKMKEPKSGQEEMVNFSNELEKRYENGLFKLRSEYRRNAFGRITMFGLATLACIFGFI